MSDIPLPLLNCPACGYDLRVMSTIDGQGRCPECGEVVNAEEWAATKLAWEHRKTLPLTQKAWVFLKTVVVAVRQPYRLASLAPHGVRAGSAAAAALPCVVTAVVLTGVAGWIVGDLLHVSEGFRSRSEVGYVWEVGADTVWALVLAGPLGMLAIARLSYEGVLLGTRASGAEARKRALSVAPFLLAGLAMLGIGLLATALVVKHFRFLVNFQYTPSGPNGAVEVIKAAAGLSVALTGVVVGLLTLLAGPVVVARGFGGASRRRAAGVLVYLLVGLALIATLIFGAIPFSIGLYRLIRYSALS